MALDRAGAKNPTDLANENVLSAAVAEIQKQDPNGQQIRSQVVDSDPSSPRKVPPPPVFQLFGQRFLLDSSVLSNVVYDSILYQGQKQQRRMPSGLDVAASLGDAEATRLLGPGLDQYHYGQNLLAARRVVDELAPAMAKESLYGGWLDALRAVANFSSTAGAVPEAMRTEAWRRKQLQTELASWAELRHDTILYGKQSYSASIACEYPQGLRRTVSRRASIGSRRYRLALRRTSSPQTRRSATPATAPLLRMAAGLRLPSRKRCRRWLAMAREELASGPFTSGEAAAFIKQTIDIRGGGKRTLRATTGGTRSSSTAIPFRPNRPSRTCTRIRTDLRHSKWASALQSSWSSQSTIRRIAPCTSDPRIRITSSKKRAIRPTDEEWSKRLGAEPPARPPVDGALRRALRVARQLPQPKTP